MTSNNISGNSISISSSSSNRLIFHQLYSNGTLPSAIGSHPQQQQQNIKIVIIPVLSLYHQNEASTAIGEVLSVFFHNS